MKLKAVWCKNVEKNTLNFRFYSDQKWLKYLEEVSDVSELQDKYTFVEMVNDFLSAEQSDNENYLYHLISILCW